MTMLIQRILKIGLLIAAFFSVPISGLFGVMAFQALTTRNIGAVLVGAVFLGYFLIVATLSLLLLIWVSFLKVSKFWNLALGLETGGLLTFLLISAPFVQLSDYRAILTAAFLCLIYGFLTWRFLSRAYAQHKLV